jgi:hypothetical protein
MTSYKLIMDFSQLLEFNSGKITKKQNVKPGFE